MGNGYNKKGLRSAALVCILKEKYLYIILSIFTVMILSLCFQDTINYDEYFSMHWCSFGGGELIRCLKNDVHPPLYYLILKAIVDLTNGNMICARLLSAVSSIVLLWFGGLFLERSFGKKSAVFFVCFLYLNPFMIQKATEIRMYIPASLFVVTSGILSYYILKEPKRKYWILFTISSLLAAYTHYYALLSMIFLYVGILIYFAFNHNKKQMLNWFICSLATVLGYLPWLPVTLKQVTSVNNNYWINTASSKTEPLKELFYTMIPYTEYFYLGIMIVLTIMNLAVFVKKRALDSYWSLMCISALWGIFLFTTWYSYKFTPILLSRYLIMPICLLILGISNVGELLNKYVLITVCLCCAFIGGDRYIDTLKSQSNHNTTRTLAFAGENFSENDVILYHIVNTDNIYYANCLTYYFDGISCIPLENLPVQDVERILDKNDIHRADTIWLFSDTAYPMEDNMKDSAIKDVTAKGVSIENCGSYGFSTINFEIYKITY